MGVSLTLSGERDSCLAGLRRRRALGVVILSARLSLSITRVGVLYFYRSMPCPLDNRESIRTHLGGGSIIFSQLCSLLSMFPKRSNSIQIILFLFVVNCNCP